MKIHCHPDLPERLVGGCPCEQGVEDGDWDQEHPEAGG